MLRLVLLQLLTTVLAGVVAGTALLQIPFPTRLRRFTQVVYRVGVAPLTAGKFDAFVSIGVQRNIARASGFSVCKQKFTINLLTMANIVAILYS